MTDRHVPLNPRQFRRRVVIGLPAMAVSFFATWALLDHLIPPNGCTTLGVVRRDDVCLSPGTIPVGVALHAIAAAGVALLVMFGVRHVLRRVEAKERSKETDRG